MKKDSPTYIFLFMLAICLFFGIALSFVHHSTTNLLKKNETLHKNRVICNAFLLEPQGTSAQAYETAVANNLDISMRTHNERTWEIFHEKGAQGNVGFVFSGIGFWDAITGILVLTSDLEKVVNIQILDQKETPGLGARIEEKAFTEQFNGLVIDWNSTDDKKIIIGSSSNPDAKNRVDAITGATQTCIALMATLNEELEQFKKIMKADPVSASTAADTDLQTANLTTDNTEG